ncbi:MAG: methionyl-tRNA formyltransferase [Lachnospiraceae bacterium]|nr:methionyl-tRNA formyltransferase [Lachnospiraceae bacterium]
MSLKIVFMGTPDFAVGALQALVEAGHEIVAVVTQPDKAKGRSGKLSFSPVKECALENGLPVFQPERIKRPEAVAELKKYEADIFVVAAFGQILSKEILDMPRLGCINIHASLLPKYRGSSPIQWSVINGEEKTGVTIQQMNEGVDTGDILYQKEIVLDKKETGESLFDRLAVLGAEAVVEVLPLIEEGKVTPVPQNHEEATHTVMLDKAMGHMDFTKNAIELERLVRGLNSWPSAYTYFDGKQLKIWESDLCEEEELSDEEQVYVKNAKPGEVVKVEKNRFAVACGNGALWITSLQLEGKKRMSTHDFLLGNAMEKGMVLG